VSRPAAALLALALAGCGVKGDPVSPAEAAAAAARGEGPLDQPAADPQRLAGGADRRTPVGADAPRRPGDTQTLSRRQTRAAPVTEDTP